MPSEGCFLGRGGGWCICGCVSTPPPSYGGGVLVRVGNGTDDLCTTTDACVYYN